MYVVKRDGRKEAVKFDKITARVIKMCYGLDPMVSPEAVAMKVIEGLYDGVSTTDLDNLAAEVAAAKTTEIQQLEIPCDIHDHHDSRSDKGIFARLVNR